MRKTTTLIVALGMVAALSGCSTGAVSAGGCDNPIVSGDASSVVTATGAFGSAPTVDFPTPVITATTQKTELITGKGAPLQDGQPVIIEVSIFNGANGKVLQKTNYGANGGSILTLGKSAFPAVSLGLECSRAGSRVVIVGSAKDSHSGQADLANGIGKDDSFVYVVDVKKAFPAKADGAGQFAQSGMPSVVLAPDGTPGITVPKQTAPTSLKINVLQAGAGTKVAEGDYVVLKYTGVLWDGATVFDSTWSKGQAAVLQIKDGSVVSGFAKGLIGQKIGSQVLLVIPPGLGYGAQGSSAVPANATLVFVVDILGIAQ
ncbi:MAG: FKBP-type peptidyl-prolyl cis-trans isomerase [Lacisediminihabitans sp.]